MTSSTYPLLYALDIIEFRYISLLNTTRKIQTYMIVAHTLPRTLSTQTLANEGLQKHLAKFRQDNATYYDINYKEVEIYRR